MKPELQRKLDLLSAIWLGRVPNLDLKRGFGLRLTGVETKTLFFLYGSPPQVTAKGKNVDLTLEISSQDFEDLMCGKLNAQVAFLSGRLSISGRYYAALSVSNWLAQNSAALAAGV